MTQPADYGRTQSLAAAGHGIAQVAFARLDVLERAFAALPGAADVDVEGLAARALADLEARHKADGFDKEALAETVARMRGRL